MQQQRGSLISISFSKDAARSIKQAKNRTHSKPHRSAPFRQFGKPQKPMQQRYYQKGTRKKALTLELMCLTTSRGTTERSSSFS